MRVDDPSALPLSDTATANGNDKVVGIDFSGGMAGVFSQIANALSITGMASSNPAGTTLQMLDDGTGGRVSMTGVSTTATIDLVRQRQWSDAVLPRRHTLPIPARSARPACRARALPAALRSTASLINDPSLLVAYQPGTAAGDATRPNFILDQLTNSSMTFNPNSGIGTVAAPFGSTLGGFLQQVIEPSGRRRQQRQYAQARAGCRSGIAAATLYRQLERQHR